MTRCEQRFFALVKNISPTPTQRAAAVRSYKHLCDVLNDGSIVSRILDNYLRGSLSGEVVPAVPRSAMHPRRQVPAFDASCLQGMERLRRDRLLPPPSPRKHLLQRRPHD